MFERFTERARQVVLLGQDEARMMNHKTLGTEHLLLGLIREGEGLASRVLDELALFADDVRNEILSLRGQGDEVTTGQIPFTPRAKKVLELALREALSLGHNYIGTEHILLGLVRENEGVAVQILLGCEVTAVMVRDRVMVALSGRKPEVRRRWDRGEVDLAQVWERGGSLYRVVGIMDSPTVTVENVTSGQRDTYVIGSPLFGEFTKLVPSATAPPLQGETPENGSGGAA